MTTRRQLATLLAALALLSGLLVPSASANHSVWNNKRFPAADIGFLWMSAWKSFSGLLFVEHNAPGCNPSEPARAAEVWQNIQNSTTGQSSMSRWGAGVRMSNQGCAGTLSTGGSFFVYSSNIMDTGIAWDLDRSHFLQPNGSYIGGRIRRQEAPSAFCAYNNVVHPCGGRAFVQINWNKWIGNDGGISGLPYERRELLHETGHSHGLIDCPSTYYGMMMNGSCGWDEGITGWNADDRASVSLIYP